METDFSRLTVLELRQELKRRNLPQSGKKADLVDRLTAFEKEQTAGEPSDAPNHSHEARDSPLAADTAEQQHGTNHGSPPADPSANSLQPSIAEDVPPAATDGNNPSDASNPPAEPAEPAESAEPAEPSEPAGPAPQDSSAGQNPAVENEVGGAGNSEPVPATEIVKDAVGRKRRSRSPPPPGDESSRKRARPVDQAGEGDSPRPLDIAATSNDNPVAKDPSPEPAHQAAPEDQREPHPQSTIDSKASAEDVPGPNQEEEQDDKVPQEDDQRQDRETRPPGSPERHFDTTNDMVADYDRQVEPAQHPATAALYIKNFMRPLRAPVLRDYLIELATAPGAAPDPDCVVSFYLDQIRTHSFVRFSSISAASRVRTALHGTVWPNERNRKELWVDFIPEDKVEEWANREQAEGGRGSSNRWEVLYERDENGDITASLVNAEMAPAHRPAARQPLGPPPVPTGPARNYPGVEGAPSGPRGRGGNHYRQAPPMPPPPPSSAGGDRGWRTTRADPPVQWRPVPEELAERRLANMNSYISRDRYRDLGRPDEINRYTFENSDEFVDRGKEAFIGIRPPHRERERRRLGIGRGNRPQRAPSPRRPRDDGYYQGSGSRDDYYDRNGDRDYDRRDRRDERDYRDRDYNDRDYRDHRGDDDDVPRSRFDGQPLPTYTGPRGPRRGGRRDRY